MRIWVSFSDDEFDFVKEKAKELGMTPQKYVSYCTLMQVGLPTIETRIEDIYLEIEEYLKCRKNGETFICSATVSNWEQLSRSDKMCVSKYIANVVEKNPDKYEIKKDGSGGHAKVYRVK